MNRFTLTIFFTIPTFVAHAQFFPDGDFHAEYSLVGGYHSIVSNLNVGGSERIDNLGTSSKKNQTPIMQSLGHISYTMGQHQVYAGTANDDIAVGNVAFEVGYRYQLNQGTVLDFSLLPTILNEEVWANPYATQVARSKTDAHGIGYRFKIENLLTKGLSVDLGYGERKINDDKVIESLKRSGHLYRAKVNYAFPISNTMTLMPAITYTKSDADGAASSYRKIDSELTVFKQIDKHQFAVTAGYAKSNFEGQATVFNNRQRDDHEISIFAAYQKSYFMGAKNWSLLSFSGYRESNSSIDFYNESELFILAGAKYEF